MRKSIIMLTALLTTLSVSTAYGCKNEIIRFSQLPYEEGTLYVSISCGEEKIIHSAVEVESDTVTIPVDLSKYKGEKVEVKAFQDLNDNRTLDFDSFGRPQEPCLQTSVAVDSQNCVLNLKLVEY